MISYRQLHVLDETYVMNGCKEDCCYVAKDFDVEMVKAKKNLVARDYVLPDFTAIRRQVTFCSTCDKPSKTISNQGFHEDCRGIQREAWGWGAVGIILFSSLSSRSIADKKLELDQHHFILKILKDTCLISRCE